MRKGFLIMLAVVLVAAMAATAMADTNVAGYFRAKGHVGNYANYGTPVIAADQATGSYVEHRLRAKIGVGDENVRAYYFAEFDQMWGDSTAGVARGSGGALGGDSINLETKNMYVWFKLPNTSFDFAVGLQSVFDSYAWILFGADMSGVTTTFKVEPATFRAGAYKFFEGDVAEADDVDFYIAEAKLAPMKDVKVGLNFYFLRSGRGSIGAAPALAAADTGSVKVYTPGIDFSAKAGPASLTGFAFFQTGKVQNIGVADVDISAFAGDLRADLNVGPGKAFVEGLYISGGDNNAAKYKSIVGAADWSATQVFYNRSGMQILFPNTDAINTATPLSINYSNGGRGLYHIAAGYSQKLGDRISGKVGAGYLSATKLLLVTDSTRKGKGMGTEVNATVEYNISKGLDFGVSGAYAWLGDFFKSNVAGAVDPDNAYDLYAKINYAF